MGTADTAAAIPLERYAEIAAHLAHFEGADQAEVLDRLGAKGDDFRSSQKAWTRAIGAELRRDDTALADVMSEVYGRTRRRLQEERPELASIGPRASEIAPPPVIADEPTSPADTEPAVLAPPPPVIVAPTELPTFLQPHAAAAAPPVMHDHPPPVMHDHPPPVMHDHPPPVMHEPAPPPLMVSPPAVPYGGTSASDDISRLARTVLPFGARPPGTQPVPAAAAPPPAAPPPAAPPKPTPLSTGTAMDVNIAEIARRVLPFPSAGAPANAAPHFTPSAAAAQRPASAAPNLTIEQYASFCVDIELEPAAAPAVIHRYGMTPEQRAQVDALFRERFRSHPDQLAAFERARQAYRAWREQTRRERR